MAARGRDLTAQRSRGSKSLSARTGNCVRPMRSCGKRQRILSRCERQRGTASALSVAARPPVSQLIAFIEESREALGVEPIRRTLQFAPSTYYDRRAVARDPDWASARARSDAALSIKIDAAGDANHKLYGARKIWHVLRQRGEDAAPPSRPIALQSHAGQRLHRGTVDVCAHCRAPADPCGPSQVPHAAGSTEPSFCRLAHTQCLSPWKYSTLFADFCLDLTSASSVACTCATASNVFGKLLSFAYSEISQKTSNSQSCGPKVNSFVNRRHWLSL